MTALNIQMVKPFSNKDYEKLGDRIRKDVNNISESDYEMLQYLRTSYKSPLSVVFNTIELLAHSVDKNCVCTYRIKRIESIVSKLIRFPEMRVNRAEDIAGCRCILSSEADVYSLLERIQKKQDKLPFEIKGKINDYIANPKESGYKSVHINVTLKGDNRRIEIQLRSLEQHNWATLVEITDLLYGIKLKENGQDSNDDLFKLHKLLSRSPQEIMANYADIQQIADIVIKYDYIKKIGAVFAQNYVDVRKHWYSLKLRQKHFFLISTGTDGIPEIQGFADFDSAENNYFEQFISNKSNKNIVLTHLQRTTFAKISVAYSNYFLTFNNTIVRILFYLSKAVENSYKKNSIFTFKKYYQAFLDIMLFWMEQQIVEINQFNNDKNIKKSRISHIEWGTTIEQGIRIFNDMFKKTQVHLRFKVWNFITYFIMRSKYNHFQTLANKVVSDAKQI